MRIHYPQHVPFEGLGNIENWSLSKRHQIMELEIKRQTVRRPDSTGATSKTGHPNSLSCTQFGYN